MAVMSRPRRLPVQRRYLAEWLDCLRGSKPQVDGVTSGDDGEILELQVALPGFQPAEIAVEIAPDHLVIDASTAREESVDGVGTRKRQADVHLLLPFPETVDCERAAARLRSGVLTIRARHLPHGPRVRVGS
jgi:HSP20 family molecular chaperone IbpA